MAQLNPVDRGECKATGKCGLPKPAGGVCRGAVSLVRPKPQFDHLRVNLLPRSWIPPATRRSPQVAFHLNAGVRKPVLEIAQQILDSNSSMKPAFAIASSTVQKLLSPATMLALFALAITPSQSVDLVIATDVIEHVDEDQLGLAEIHRVLRPGGTVLFTVPAFPSL